jgi:hypothetical protein
MDARDRQKQVDGTPERPLSGTIYARPYENACRTQRLEISALQIAPFESLFLFYAISATCSASRCLSRITSIDEGLWIRCARRVSSRAIRFNEPEVDPESNQSPD